MSRPPSSTRGVSVRETSDIIATSPGLDPALGSGYNPAKIFRSGYVEPRELGCRCDVCPLGELHRKAGTWRPVPPEVHDGAKILIAGEAPGENEVRQRRPLVGNSWFKMLEPTLESYGVERADLALANTLLCWPPLNDLDKIHGQVKSKNRRISAQNARIVANKTGEPLIPLIPQPEECCRPGLRRMALAFPKVLSIGSTAFTAITGQLKAIAKVRGAFIDKWLTPHATEGATIVNPGQDLDPTRPPPGFTHVQLTPTWHPAYVLQAPEWAEAFHQDVGRFLRWIRGQSTWRRAPHTMNPRFEVLRDFLYRQRSIMFVDIETDGVSVLPIEVPGCGMTLTNLRCIGFSDGEISMAVHFRSVPGDSEYRRLGDEPEVLRGEISGYYEPHEAAAIREMLRSWLADPRYLKGGHNLGYFDAAQLAVSRELSVEIGPYVDTILVMRNVYTELNRTLYTLGTLTTDVPDWKAADDERNVAVNPRNSEELSAYNGIDTSVNARAYPTLVTRANRYGVWDAVAVDHQVQAGFRGAHRLGMRVDQQARADLELRYREIVAGHRQRVDDLLGGRRFNPGSTQDLGTLLYDDWNCPTLVVTETGDPSTDSNALLKLRLAGAFDAQQERVIDAIIQFRADAKRLATTILPLRMWNDYRTSSTGKQVGGLCGPDGRLHAHYNAHTPATGRASSSKMNFQNFEKWMRSLLIPEDGHVFIIADYDQIELRLASGVAGAEGYLRVLRLGGDPHALTAEMIYQQVFTDLLNAEMCPACIAKHEKTGVWGKKCKSCKYGEKYELLRTFAKNFVYGAWYGASAQTQFETVSSAVDERTGKLLFPGMTFKMVDAAHRAWLKANPEALAFWAYLMDHAKKYGYVREPVLGRIREVPSLDPNVIKNFPIQGAAAGVMGMGMSKVIQAIPFDYERRTGLVNQCHDAIAVEVHERDAEWACAAVTENLSMSIPTIKGIDFTAEGEICIDWAENKTGKPKKPGMWTDRWDELMLSRLTPQDAERYRAALGNPKDKGHDVVAARRAADAVVGYIPSVGFQYGSASVDATLVLEAIDD